MPTRRANPFPIRKTPLNLAYIPGSIASTIPATPTVAMLSICNPGWPIPLDDGFGAVLRLEFSDVDDRAVPAWRDAAAGLAHRLGRADLERLALNRRNGGWPVVPFSCGDAAAIIDFVRTLPAEVRVLLIHCEYGKSRSRAVAEFLADKGEAFGGTVLGDFRPLPDPSVVPNRRVARLLRAELARISCRT